MERARDLLSRLGRNHWPFLLVLVAIGPWYLLSLDGGFILDEVIYVEAAHRLIDGDPYYNLEHPPFGKELIAFGLLASGGKDAGARAAIAAFSLVGITATYAFGARLAGRGVGAVSALLVATLGMVAHTSTTATIDSPLLAPVVVAAWMAVAPPPSWRKGRVFGVAGAAIALACATKFYGLFFVLVPLAVLLRRSVAEPRVTLKPFATSFLVTLALVYAPILLIPHPPVSHEAAGPLLRSALAIPVLGNLVYATGAAYLSVFGHLSSGHAVEIAGTVYEKPPAWAYGFWMLMEAGLLSLGLFLPWLAWRLRATGREIPLVSLCALAPLFFLSLLSVKFPRYAVAALPLLVIAFTASVVAVATSRPWPRLAEQRRGVALGVTLLLALVPPASTLPTVTTPLATDSGYRDMAERLGTLDPANESLLVWNALVLEHYLRAETWNLTDLDYANATTLSDVRAGRFSLVVDYQDQPRFADRELYAEIRARSTAVERVPARLGGDTNELVLFRLDPSP